VVVSGDAPSEKEEQPTAIDRITNNENELKAEVAAKPKPVEESNTLLSKIKAGMTVKRAMYEMDDFIKMGQVRSIVNEALNSLIDRIGKSDQLAKSNRIGIENNDTKINSLM
jgi:hypothetical protein